jgi:hypothetical protein
MQMPNKTLRIPLDLPGLQSPKYRCGGYGSWNLRAKAGETFERGYFTGFAAEPPGHYLIKDGHIWMSTSRLERESHGIHLKQAQGEGGGVRRRDGDVLVQHCRQTRGERGRSR